MYFGSCSFFHSTYSFKTLNLIITIALMTWVTRRRFLFNRIVFVYCNATSTSIANVINAFLICFFKTINKIVFDNTRVACFKNIRECIFFIFIRVNNRFVRRIFTRFNFTYFLDYILDFIFRLFFK